MLEFLCGSAGSGKTEEIYRRAEADAALGKAVFILVPEQYSMYSERELILRLGLKAQSKIQILTFSRLSNMVFSRLGPLRTRYIDNAGKYLAACRAVQLTKQKLTVFSRNAGQQGFAKLLVSIISEFKRYGITPAALNQAAEKSNDSALCAKLRDLSVIYEKFDELVCENHANTEDNLTVALSKLPDCDFLSGTVYVNFFRSFTPTEHRALNEIIKKSDLCVALCTDTLSAPSNVFSTQIRTYGLLKKAAEDMGIAVKQPVFLTEEKRFAENPELKHLKDGYFSHSAKKMSGNPSSIHLYRPSNRGSEVRECARLIRRLCRTEGLSQNDFLILTGNMADYELLIPSVFEEYGISFFLDRKIKLTESPLMRMVISILEIAAFGFSYERVMTVVRSGFWNIEREVADIFENYVLAADITHKQWNSTEPWVYNPRAAAFDMETVNKAKASVLHPIIELLHAFSGRKTVGEICQRLCEWFNSLGLCETVTSKIDEYTATGDLELAEQLHRVWDSFVSVINQISECMPDTYATFTEFYELFTATCGELSVGIIPPTQDRVVISEVSRFRSTGTKIVMVLGVCDRAFPRSCMTEGLLSDAERIRLSELGLTTAPDACTRQREELFLIYSVLTTASRELYMFSPVSDRDGKSLGSSEIFKRIKGALFPDLEIRSEETGVEAFESSTAAFSYLTAQLIKLGFDPDSYPPHLKQLYDYFWALPAYRFKLSGLKNMYISKGEPPQISKKTAERLYGFPLVLSVSKLEKYNSCAFSFFMRYGLFAEERMLGGLKATDTGTLLHNVLSNYFEANRNADYAAITRDMCTADISNIVNRLARDSKNEMFTSSNYYGYMLLRLKSIAAATAWKLVKFYEHSSFRPEGFEISFGSRGKLPAYEIPSDNGGVRLEGFIDRIDKAAVGEKSCIIITDYKSSEKRMEPALIDAGITIQPLIYANAAARSFDGCEPVSMMYLQMNDPILKCDTAPDGLEWERGMNDGIRAHGIFLDEPAVIEAIDNRVNDKNAVHYISCDKKSALSRELFESKLKDAEACASRTADSIISGQIDASPHAVSGFDPCAYCPYGAVCLKNESL